MKRKEKQTIILDSHVVISDGQQRHNEYVKIVFPARKLLFIGKHSDYSTSRKLALRMIAASATEIQYHATN